MWNALWTSHNFRFDQIGDREVELNIIINVLKQDSRIQQYEPELIIALCGSDTYNVKTNKYIDEWNCKIALPGIRLSILDKGNSKYLVYVDYYPNNDTFSSGGRGIIIDTHFRQINRIYEPHPF